MVKRSDIKVGDCLMHEQLGQVFRVTRLYTGESKFSVKRIDDVYGGMYLIMEHELNNFHKLGRLARLLYIK